MDSSSAVSLARRRGIVWVATALLIATSGTAWAKDSINAEVTNATGAPLIVNNGQAVGIIQLFYTVDATQFDTNGVFATFDIDWTTIAGQQATNYGSGITFDLIQDQQGGHVDLVPLPSSFTLTSAGQSGKSTVTVYITNDKAGKAPPTVDGTDLVGNLKLDAGRDVSTVTSIQVHIRLVHPTNCIKFYNFVTDQDFNLGILSAANLNVPSNGRNAGKVVSSQPGQFSDNVLIANVCGIAESFHLGVTLDPSFSTNPAGNPGNAVFMYNASGELDPGTFGSILSTVSTAYQQSLCLLNVTISPGTSILVTVHSKVKDAWPQSSLPGSKTFSFSATLYDTTNASCSGALEPLVSPNPASFTLPFTINGV